VGKKVGRRRCGNAIGAQPERLVDNPPIVRGRTLAGTTLANGPEIANGRPHIREKDARWHHAGPQCQGRNRLSQNGAPSWHHPRGLNSDCSPPKNRCGRDPRNASSDSGSQSSNAREGRITRHKWPATPFCSPRAIRGAHAAAAVIDYIQVKFSVCTGAATWLSANDKGCTARVIAKFVLVDVVV
jgi:hypothetical protein